MKIIMTGIAAAALMAVPALAQVANPGATTPNATPSGSMGPSTSGTMGTATTPPAADTGMSSSMDSSTSATTLTERNGKWYSGDREATSSEIAAYKKNKKAGRPG